VGGGEGKASFSRSLGQTNLQVNTPTQPISLSNPQIFYLCSQEYYPHNECIKNGALRQFYKLNLVVKTFDLDLKVSVNTVSVYKHTTRPHNSPVKIHICTAPKKVNLLKEPLRVYKFKCFCKHPLVY
jgi:hypothetical protein